MNRPENIRSGHTNAEEVESNSPDSKTQKCILNYIDNYTQPGRFLRFLKKHATIDDHERGKNYLFTATIDDHERGRNRSAIKVLRDLGIITINDEHITMPIKNIVVTINRDLTREEQTRIWETANAPKILKLFYKNKKLTTSDVVDILPPSFPANFSNIREILTHLHKSGFLDIAMIRKNKMQPIKTYSLSEGL